MKQHSTLLTIGLFYCGLTYSQVDTSYVVCDTLVENFYHKNGQLRHIDKFVKGRDMHSYYFSFWYYKNGNPKWLSYWDSFIDTSFSYSGRKNGTVKFRDIRTKDYFESIKQNSQGQLIERTISYFKDTFTTEEKYKHGQLYSTKQETKKQLQSTSKIDTVKYYQGQVGGSSGVIEIENNGIKEFTVNGTKMNEGEYLVYKDKYDLYIKCRTPKHFYKEYSADSILDYEGIFRGVDLPCDVYREYYPNGVVKVRGQYNNNGEKNSWWTYYNEQGLIYKKELYENGQLKE